VELPAKPVEEPVKPAEPKSQSLIEKFFEPVVQKPKRDLQRGVELAEKAEERKNLTTKR
jgi:hypothetical protein